MAKKGMEFKSYSTEFKEQILKEYFSGEGGTRALAKRHGIPRQSIYNWITKAKNNIDISVDGRGRGSKGKGRPKTRNLTLEDYKERYEIIKKYQAFLQARRGKK